MMHFLARKRKKFLIISIGLALIIFLLILNYFERIEFVYKAGKQIQKIELRSEKDTTITLVNIGEGNREYIANLIERITSCNPKVVAVDVFFIDRKDKGQDNHLAEAIGKGCTILATKGYGNGLFVESHSKFKNRSKDSGIVQLFDHAGIVMTYRPIRKMNDPNESTIEHFSYVVAKTYDSILAKAYIEDVNLDTEYYIDFQYKQQNFKVYDYLDSAFNCEDINGKIVVLGYLGPSNEDKFMTPLGLMNTKEYNPKIGNMYGAVILSNIILSILQGRTPEGY